MEKLIESHRNNPELQCTLNIDEILDSAENVDVEYIGNHSLQTFRPPPERTHCHTRM